MVARNRKPCDRKFRSNRSSISQHTYHLNVEHPTETGELLKDQEEQRRDNEFAIRQTKLRIPQSTSHLTSASSSLI